MDMDNYGSTVSAKSKKSGEFNKVYKISKHEDTIVFLL